MRYQLSRRCEKHVDPYECPDRVVVHSERYGVWGLIIHDGGRAVVGISFCPWCGQKLDQ
ncbi:DUF6980 family protein [Actinocorallia lasiicapitis]